MSTEAPKKKKAVVFRPQNSSQPLPQKKKTVKKPAVSKEEDAKRTESTAVKVEKSQPVADNKQQETKMREEKQQEPVKKETGKREDNRNQKRDGGQRRIIKTEMGREILKSRRKRQFQSRWTEKYPESRRKK